MQKASGYTFVHNGINGGYPFVEAIKMVKYFADEVVVVDMQSDDGTRQVLEKLDVRIIDGTWTPGTAGKCLAENHALHVECRNDVIWHFEADEVYSGDLAKRVAYEIQRNDKSNLAVWRLQVEQNFQRCRWYPELVHRVFYKGTVQKSGHTTRQHQENLLCIDEVPPENGYLWDVTNCFRDDWLGRLKQQSELWGGDPSYRYVPYHFTLAPAALNKDDLEEFFTHPKWMWCRSPFDIPTILKKLVGVTRYRDHLMRQGLL